MRASEANNLRLLAGDLVERLRAARKRGQLAMLQIQVGAALSFLDRIDARAAANGSPRRSYAEQVWMERGTKR